MSQPATELPSAGSPLYEAMRAARDERMRERDEAKAEVARLRLAIARIDVACTEFQVRGKIVPAPIYDEVRAAVQTASTDAGRS